MPISKVSNVVTETAPQSMDQFLRTGVILDSEFAICNKDRLKQLKFDTSSLTTNTTLTFTSPTGSGGTVTAPTSGTLAISTDLLVNTYQYSTPVAAATVTITAGKQQLVLDPAGTLATLTAVMPTAPADGTTVGISSSQTVTALTHSAGGADTLTGALTTISANGFAKYIYRTANTTWYRIG